MQSKGSGYDGFSWPNLAQKNIQRKKGIWWLTKVVLMLAQDVHRQWRFMTTRWCPCMKGTPAGIAKMAKKQRRNDKKIGDKGSCFRCWPRK